MACLVQQLFRQKIGQELEQGIVDEVLFPMLRSRKDLPRELILDIKLTQSADSNEYGQSAIVICRVIDPNDDVPEEGVPQNISPFEVPLGPHNLWIYPSRLQRLPGKIPSQMRRLRHQSLWGSIDILNELRSLIQPQFGQHRPVEVTIDPGRIGPPDCSARRCGITGPQDEFGGIYILLEEVPPWSCRQEKRLSDLKFMNDYLDDALNTGKCISWGGDNITAGRKILSTHY